MWQPHPELTPRRVLRDKKRASARPKGQFLSVLKDAFFRQFDQDQSVVNYLLLFEVHMKLGFKSEVATFIW